MEEIIDKINEINKKIDILFSSDLLNKKILNEHENKIKNLENIIK